MRHAGGISCTLTPQPLSRRERGEILFEVGGAKMSTDVFQRPLGVLEDLLVGDAQDRETGGAEEGVAVGVALGDAGFAVIVAIGFDHQASLFAEEVDDEVAQRLLASELGPSEAPPAKQLPERTLSRCAGAAQRPGTEGLRPKKASHA